MIKTFKAITIFYIFINILNVSISSENFFKKGLELYNDKNFVDAQFMFERSIVFNPKDSNSYLYLAKIYNHKEDKQKEEKNLKTSLLIEPNNEEAILMLLKISLEKSNYSTVKELSKTYTEVCKKLYDENKDNLETSNTIYQKNKET